MSIDQTAESIEAVLTPVMSQYGFRRLAPVVYSRENGDTAATCRFPLRVSANDTAKFTCHVVLSTPALADVDRVTGLPSELVSPLHYLRADDTFTEWSAESLPSLQRAAVEVSDDMGKLVMPLLKRCASLDGLLECVRENDSHRRFVLTSYAKAIVEASLLVALGRRSDAVSVLDEAAKLSATAKPSVRDRLKAMQAYVSLGIS